MSRDSKLNSDKFLQAQGENILKTGVEGQFWFRNYTRVRIIES